MIAITLSGINRRTEHSAQPTTRVPVPSGGQIDLEGAWVPLHAHVSEDYSAHSDMASRANKSVVLKATDSRRVLRDHVREDQLSVTCCTVHRSHSLAERPPIVASIEHFHPILR